MDSDPSRKILEQVHDEINNTNAVDEKDIEMLRDLDKDIRMLIERSGEHAEPVHSEIIERMQDSLTHFEVDHPELTSLISKLIDSLSNAGV
jgi:hypothetical protein